MKAGEEVKRIREDITRIRGMYNKIAIKDLKASISESPDIEDSVNLEEAVYAYNNLQTDNVKRSGHIELY